MAGCAPPHHLPQRNLGSKHVLERELKDALIAAVQAAARAADVLLNFSERARI